MPEDGLAILLTLQLVLSIGAALAWWRAARDPSPGAVKLAAYVSCAWFALVAGAIAYLFDTDLIWFGAAN
ncbi:MAG: hypothetical protein ACM3ZV_14375 [Bacillota bacterium]